MIPIVFVLVYKLEKCIQHINKRNIFLSSEATYGKKNSLEAQQKCSQRYYFIGPVKLIKITINDMKMYSVSNHEGKIS